MNERRKHGFTGMRNIKRAIPMKILVKYNKKHNFCVLAFVMGLSLIVYLIQKETTSEQLFDKDVNMIKESNDSENKNRTKISFQGFQDIQVSTSNIFFIETRCTTNKLAEVFRNSGDLVLTARQSCAIESTARTNPDRKVYVLLSCLSENFSSSPFLPELADLPGVKLDRLDPKAILQDSPAQRLGEIGPLESSIHPVEHSSDILRMALLWKFGGTYCDLDVVTVRSLEPLGTDWVGLQSPESIANGVINISPSGMGHELMGRALEMVAKNFNPTAWSANGPELITPLILDMCGVDKVEKAESDCQNFTVLNSSVLYPIYYPRWMDLFDAIQGPGLVDQLVSMAYSIHFWNKLSHGSKVQLNSSQPYAILAKRYCPVTAASVEEL